MKSTFLIAALLFAAPVQAGNLTIHNKSIHRGQRDMQQVVRDMHGGVHANLRVNFTPQAQEQRGKGYTHSMRCTGGLCRTTIDYVK